MRHDRDRHGPVRIEIDLHDLGVELGRRAVRLADDGDMARHHGAVLDRLELCRRDVAHDEAVRSLGVEPAQARQVDLQLIEPLIGRDVERLDGERAHATVRRDAVARLEAAHRRLNIGVVDIVLDGARIEIARKLQALAQRHHCRVASAEPQAIIARHLRPAALRDDLLVTCDRGLRRLDVRGRQCRQRRLRHLYGARRRVEPLPYIVALVLLDQLLQRIIVLREGARRCGARRQARQDTAAVDPAHPKMVVFPGHVAFFGAPRDFGWPQYHANAGLSTRPDFTFVFSAGSARTSK